MPSYGKAKAVQGDIRQSSLGVWVAGWGVDLNSVPQSMIMAETPNLSKFTLCESRKGLTMSAYLVWKRFANLGNTHTSLLACLGTLHVWHVMHSLAQKSMSLYMNRTRSISWRLTGLLSECRGTYDRAPSKTLTFGMWRKIWARSPFGVLAVNKGR